VSDLIANPLAGNTNTRPPIELIANPAPEGITED
jgi:hypothetical protein